MAEKSSFLDITLLNVEDEIYCSDIFDRKPSEICKQDYVFYDGKYNDPDYGECRAVIGLEAAKDDTGREYAVATKIVYDPVINERAKAEQSYPSAEAFIHGEILGTDENEILEAVQNLCKYNGYDQIPYDDMPVLKEFLESRNIPLDLTMYQNAKIQEKAVALINEATEKLEQAKSMLASFETGMVKIAEQIKEQKTKEQDISL